MRTFALIALLSPACALAQALEPRAYSNLPVGLNFLIAGYTYSKGGIAFDPSVPLENGQATVQSVPLAYVRSLDILGNASSVAFLLPLARASGSAALNGIESDREVSGTADPGLRLAVNFHGAPAMSLAEFRTYRQDLIIGASLFVTAPLGQYDSKRAVNLGTNRWSAKPEIGLSQALGPWTVELNAGATWFSKNDDYLQGNTREQDPLYSAQLHVTRDLGPGTWGALSVTYYEGGRTMLNGVPRDDRESGSRFGLTLALPLARQHSLKLFASTGIYARTGADFNTVGAAWQYLWVK